MKDKLLKFIKTKPVFILLLPVFFILHGVTEYFNFIPTKEAAVLTMVYIGASLVLAILFWFLFRNWTKAGLAAFAFMAFNFFFGSVHDFLKNGFRNSFIVKYSFILPVALILAIFFIVYLKKTKRKFTRITIFLNCLLLLLILVDFGTLLIKSPENQRVKVGQLFKEFTSCDTCSRPDIYLIIVDEYAGETQLKDLFSFDNSDFENDLIKRGFHVVKNSKSNYNITQFSIASMLNINYLNIIKNKNTIDYLDVFACNELIKNNNIFRFLNKSGYSIYNFSFLDFENTIPVRNSFSLSTKKLITSQTFIYRFIHNLGFNFASHQKMENIVKQNLYYNLKVENLTREIAVNKISGNRFVYTHFTMPHWPYYFDSSGKETDYGSLSDDNKFNKKAYIDYLLYSNKKLLELVEFIKNVSSKPPIIILIGDHGFRQLPDSVDKKYYFSNLNSIYLPDSNYGEFYEGMSNVNQFRVILNSQFGQKLSLLKDSTSFLIE